MRRTLALLVLGFASALPSAACTTFCIAGADGLVFGRNYDYFFGDATVLVNPRGVEKVSLIDVNPARWTSAYGSVTFNQYGKDSPAGGVNEKGLVIEVMTLEGAKYPPQDNRPNIGALEWIQYLLDNSASVEEAIGHAQKVRIATLTPLHFLLADRTGDAAAVEFLRGKMVVRRGESLPDCALSNSTYAQSQDYEARTKVNLAQLPRGDEGSLERFARVARAVRQKPANAVEKSFEALDQVVQPGSTQWQIVYDLPRNAVHYRTAANRERRTIDLAKLDYACRNGGRILDIDTGRSDVTAALMPYTAEANERQMLAAFAKSPHFGIPAPRVRAEAAQLESRRCVAAG